MVPSVVAAAPVVVVAAAAPVVVAADASCAADPRSWTRTGQLNAAGE